MGLARLWQSWGIEPDVVLGHSVGQYAAACVAGVFSLEDGARLMAERGRLFGNLPEGGRMVAVFADAQRVERAAEEFPRISVAAYNGPNTVLSGPGEDLEQIVAKLTDDGIRCTWLDTSHAFHSELLEPALDEFESYAKGFEFAVPTLPLVCNRTGAVLTAETPLDAQYWRRHSRQPVQFAESVQTVAKLGCSVLMEIGPQPVLTGAAVQAWPESSAAPRAVVCLRKGTDARRQIAEALAAVYVAGHRPDFAALHHQPRRRFELPTYPFQRRRFWPKNADIRGVEGQGATGVRNPGQRKGSRLRRHRLHQPVVRQDAAVAGASRHLRHRCRSGRDVRGDGPCRGRGAGTGAQCLLLRADHPARQGFSGGAADSASARGRAAAGPSRCTAARTASATLSGR